MRLNKFYTTITIVCLLLFIIILTFTCIADINVISEQENLRLEAQEISETINYLTVEIQTAPFATNSVPESTPQTYYDTLTDDEINMLEITIQHEVGNFSFEYKELVAELIYNRIESDQFPNTVIDVLFQDGQFQEIGTWYYSGLIPDEDTKAAVKTAFSREYSAHDCLYYYNPELSSYNSIIWFEYSGDVEYVFSWTERDWGIDYETRFFR